MKRTVLGTLVLLAVGTFAQASFAQSSGVHCPSGYESDYSTNLLKCSKIERVYVYPVGHDFGNASTPARGVKCPADSNDRVAYENGVLKCVDRKVEIANAYCTIGWELKVSQGQDACRSLVGNMDPTLPDGHISREGWSLLVDNSGNRDAWKRVTSRYEYPVAR
jgi:hypothetical protein